MKHLALSAQRGETLLVAQHGHAGVRLLRAGVPTGKMSLCEPGVACALLLLENEAWVALKDGTLAAIDLREETMLRRVGLHGEAVRRMWSTRLGVLAIDEGGKVRCACLSARQS